MCFSIRFPAARTMFGPQLGSDNARYSFATIAAVASVLGAMYRPESAAISRSSTRCASVLVTGPV